MDNARSRKPLQDRLANMERRIEVLETIARAAQAAPTAAPIGTTPPTSAPAPVLAPPAPPPSAPATREREPVNVERWLKWTGVALVVLAASFLLNLAIQRGWLTPTIRVAGGLAIGAAMYTTGLLARSRGNAFATALQAGGATIAYLMTWSAFQVFELFPFWVSATGMAGIIVILLVEVVRERDPALAALATVGGFAIPFLLSTTSGDPGGPGAETIPLVAYVSFFIVLTGVLHLFIGWRTLRITAAGAAVLSLFIAAAVAGPFGSLDTGEAWALTVGFSLAAASYWLAPALLHRLVDERRALRPPSVGGGLEHGLDQVADMLGFVLLPVLAGMVTLAWDLNERHAGITTLGLAAIAALVVVGSRDHRRGIIINGALASFLLTVGLALVLEGEARLVALAAQAGALHFIAQRTDTTIARINGHVLATVAGMITLGQMAEGYWDSGWAGPLSLVAVIAIGAWAGTEQSSEKWRATYLVAAYGLGLLLIWHLLGSSDVGQALVTGAWAAIGLGALLAGRARDSRPVELAGTATLGIVLVKLFLVDLAMIDPFTRVFLFLGVGVLFLGVGWFVTQGRDGAKV